MITVLRDRRLYGFAAGFAIGALLLSAVPSTTALGAEFTAPRAYRC